MNLIAIAEICHEANRLYCKQLGDNSQPTWDNAQEWQRQSAINGVKFHIARPNATAADSHVNWYEEKVANGWTYGPEKDPALKKHPCLVPYDQLPIEQRRKDALFIGVVHALRD